MPSCFVVKCLYRCEHVDEDFDKDGIVRRVSALYILCVISAYKRAHHRGVWHLSPMSFIFKGG